MGAVAGAAKNRNGPSVTAPAAKPVEWMGEAAATIPSATPPGGGPPSARIRLQATRMIEVPKSAYSAQVCTKIPRSPELPPEARHTYSPCRRLGPSAADAARCASTVLRSRRRSVTTSSNASIISALRITGRLGRSLSSNRDGSTPPSRPAWKGERSIARANSARSRSRW